MVGTAIFDIPTLGGHLTPYNVTQTHSTLRKFLYRHAKGNSMVNFYIVNALGQNIANSESGPILRLL